MTKDRKGYQGHLSGSRKVIVRPLRRGGSGARHLLVAAASAVFLVGGAEGANAQEGALEIGVLPESVLLSHDEPGHAEVIVRNPSADEARNIKLRWFAPPSVSVIVLDPSVETLAQGDAHTFAVEVRQAAGGSLPGQVTFKVLYRLDGEAGPRFVSGTLKVEAAAVEAAATVTKLEIKTTLASLSEQRPGRLYLLVANTTNVPITVDAISELKPTFITLTRVHEGALTVTPGATRVIEFAVTAGGALQPGKHLIVIIATLSWERGGDHLAGSVVISQEAGVEIFGESAILGLLAVPSVLLLPGALIVLAFTLGLKWLWKREKLPVEPKEATFWLIAVPLSFLMGAIYPRLGGQNYLLAYSFSGLIRLWVISSAVGVIAFAIWWLSGAIVRRLTLPKEDDKPIVVLKKLKRRWSRVYRPRVLVELDGQKAEAFLLQRQIKAGVGQWVGPRILAHFDPASPLREQVERHLTRSGRIKDVYEILNDADEGQVRLRFERTNAIRRPLLAQGVAGAGRDDLIVVPRTGLE